jgi:hypothetical protein
MKFWTASGAKAGTPALQPAHLALGPARPAPPPAGPAKTDLYAGAHRGDVLGAPPFSPVHSPARPAPRPDHPTLGPVQQAPRPDHPVPRPAQPAPRPAAQQSSAKNSFPDDVFGIRCSRGKKSSVFGMLYSVFLSKENPKTEL